MTVEEKGINSKSIIVTATDMNDEVARIDHHVAKRVENV